MSFCKHCEHCDTDEGGKVMRGKLSLMTSHRTPGMCTLRNGWFNGQFVPDWMSGCEDFEPATSAQADGDAGEDDAA